MNPYATRLITDSPDGVEVEVYDTRDGQGLKWFGVRRCGGIAEATRAAEAWAADLWIAEAAEAARDVDLWIAEAAEAARAAELAGFDPTPVSGPEPELEISAPEAITPYHLNATAAYAVTAGVLRYVLHNAHVEGIAFHGTSDGSPLPAAPDAALMRRLAALWHALFAPAPAAPVIAAAPGSLTPTPAQIEAALSTLEADARRAKELCAAAGYAEGAKIARRSERAYRDAAALALAGEWLLTPRGDLLVRSASGRGIWHRVGRVPAASDSGYSPITCSCEWGTKGDGLGPCKHQGLFEGIELAQDALLAEADAAAERDARGAFGLAAD